MPSLPDDLPNHPEPEPAWALAAVLLKTCTAHQAGVPIGSSSRPGR